jgi:hypothetical protein
VMNKIPKNQLYTRNDHAGFHVDSACLWVQTATGGVSNGN